MSLAVTSNSSFLHALDGGLIVSCQPVDDGPMDSVATIAALALAAQAGGARAIRIEGAKNVTGVAAVLDLPIIGIVKRDLDDSPIRITPFVQDVKDLAAAGAKIIAVDATNRKRPVEIQTLLAAIHECGCLAMADLSNIAEAHAAKAMGFDIIGTTMSGYTGGIIPKDPDVEFLKAVRSQIGGCIVAEGRYNTPEAATLAMRCGASLVCVGSAITRTEHVVSWFADAVAHGVHANTQTVLALDIGGTKTSAALVKNGEILDRVTFSTPSDVASPEWFAHFTNLASTWDGQFVVVGAAVTGLVQGGNWSALNPVTLNIPENTPLQSKLAHIFKAQVTIKNDAQAATWGEYKFGAGQGKDIVFVTVSSGVGGGIVINGKLIEGARGLAGSLGQVRGQTSDRLETTASGFAISAVSVAHNGSADTRDIFAQASAGDQAATSFIHTSAKALANALIDVQLLIDPDLIVLGGGIGLLPEFKAILNTAMMSENPRLTPVIVAAQLGADAGLVGIADLAITALHS